MKNIILLGQGRCKIEVEFENLSKSNIPLLEEKECCRRNPKTQRGRECRRRARAENERKRNVWRDCSVDWASFLVFNFLVGRF